MASTKIILEAPEFGAGRQGKKRPVNLGACEHIADNSYVEQTALLNEFSSNLRKFMHQLSECEGQARAKLAKQIAGSAETVGADDLVKIAEKISKEPDVARHLANFSKVVISTSNFIASINRL